MEGVLKRTNSGMSGLLASVRSTAFSSTKYQDRRSLRTYSDAIRMLDSVSSESSVGRKKSSIEDDFGSLKLCLSSIGYSMEHLDQLNVIHVTGTKGKGSVCAMTESILRSLRRKNGFENFKTGLFTSPHLIDPTERVKINGKSISREEFARSFFRIWDKVNLHPVTPTYFKYMFLIAIDTFIREKVDVTIIEVGIGGQYDTTNIIRSPKVCAVSLVGHDHQDILGESLESISWNKSGIFKTGCVAITVPQKGEVMEVLKARARESNVKNIIVVDKGLPLDVDLRLDGKFQRMNASLSVEIVRSWCREVYKDLGDISEFARAGLSSVEWPGRAQIIRSDNAIKWYLDGAHNIESMEACVDWFESKSEDPTCLIFNLTKNRNFDDVARCLMELHSRRPFKRVIFTSDKLKQPGDTEKQKLFAQKWKNATAQMEKSSQSEIIVSNYIQEAMILASETPASKAPNVLITGSLYLVGGALEILQYKIT